MATSTTDFLDYLDQQIGIAPANSQEELLASECLEGLFGAHGIETTVQEFDMPASAPMVRGIVQALLFVGVLLSGLTMTPLVIPSVLVAIAAGALLISDTLGYGVLKMIGPSGKSQNVIAYHPKTGDLATKGSRPIVIVAHYDTPRESVLARPEIARFQGIIKRIAFVCVPVATVLALVQLVFGAGTLVRRILWLIAFLASLPAGFLGVCAILDSIAACTVGANDNKSSVAALLGVLEAVAPSSGDLSQKIRRKKDEPAYGVRHGAEVIASMGMLPETCEVVYVEEAPEELVQEEPEAAEEAKAEPQALESEAPAVEEPLMGDGDDAGFSEIGFDPDATAPVAATERTAPPTPDDPSWGTSEFTPNPENVARRAALFDLPDPSKTSADPLDAGIPEVPAAGQVPETVRFDDSAKTTVFRAQPAATDAAQERTEARKSRFFGRRRAQQGESMSQWLGVDEDFDAKEDGRNIGSWDHFNDDEQTGWKGGAALDPSLRHDAVAAGDDDLDGLTEAVDFPVEAVFDEDGAEPELGVEDLQDAILEMDDDALVAHDIWFVALGASSVDHAGMDAFLAEYRKTCRGAFVINLDSVGAGDLTAITAEGIHNRRRADRRMLRLFSNTAKDLHVELGQATHSWGDTDATSAMRSSMRSVTIMGMNEFGMPALSGTAQDIRENVDDDQVASVARVVTELIRRS